MSAHTQELAGIRERHNALQEIDEPSDVLGALEAAHEDRASLLAIVDRVEEFARDLERKGKECQEQADQYRAGSIHRRPHRAKASTYEAEARSLRQILESA